MTRMAGLILLALTAAWNAAAEDPVTLYYWGEEKDSLAPEVLQGFEALHDGSDGKPVIKVIMGQSACYNKTDDPQRITTAVAGGNPPDVVFFDRFAVGEWAARGAFTSLQPFLDRDLRDRPDDPMTLRREQFYEPCWAEATYNSQLYAIPIDTDNRCLYYNLDILDKYADKLIPIGCVDEKDLTKVGPPRTWDQLKQAAKIMSEYDSEGRIVRLGFIPHFKLGNSWLYIYGWLNGAKFMSDDGKTCLLNEPAVVEALAYMTELYDTLGGGKAVSAFESTLVPGDLDAFLTGKLAMKIDTDLFVANIMNMRPNLRFGVALAPAPEGKQRLGWCGGWCAIIPRGTKHPDEAWELVKYLASFRAYQIKADVMRQAASISGLDFMAWIHARKDITEWGLKKYLYDDPTIDEKFKVAKRVFVDAMPFSKYRPVTPVGQSLWFAQVRAMNEGIFKQHDPDPLKNAQIACDRNTAVVQADLDRIFKAKPHPVIRWEPIIGAYAALMAAAMAFGYWYFNRNVKARGYFRKEFRAGYLFALPWFAGFIVFGGGPIFFSLIMSFCDYDVLSPPKFVGLANYAEMFTRDELFYKSLWNTVYMTLGIPLGMIVGLGIALLLNQEVKGMAVYRTFFYLPSVMPAVAASILWIWIFNPNQGVLNSLLAYVGIHGPAWLQDQAWSKPALIIMGVWSAGSSMIIWLAGLKGIPRHLYEAAEIDGAGRLRRFISITLPMLSPYILFNLVMGLIGTFQIFTQALIMTQGGPVDSTLFYVYNLFNYAFRYLRMGYASAMAWVLFAIVLVLTMIQMRLSKRWVYYESDT